MGRLSGFRYREIIRRLKQFGFTFDRQAAGSHEICYWGGGGDGDVLKTFTNDVQQPCKLSF